MPGNPESQHVLDSPLHFRKAFVSSLANTTMGEFTEKSRLKSLCPAHFYLENPNFRDFPSGAVDENLPASAGDTGLIPGPGRFQVL